MMGPRMERRLKASLTRGVLGTLLSLALASIPAPSIAHESPLPSAQLMQRDGGHFILSLKLDAARALQRTLLPDAAPGEALALLSAMEPERFAQGWDRATKAWAQGSVLLVQGRTHPAMRWAWPSAQEAQALLQRQLMPQLTGTHAEHELLGAQAEFRTGGEAVTQAQLKLPAALRPLSVTTMRPRQQWTGEGENPIAVKF